MTPGNCGCTPASAAPPATGPHPRRRPPILSRPPLHNSLRLRSLNPNNRLRPRRMTSVSQGVQVIRAVRSAIRLTGIRMPEQIRSPKRPARSLRVPSSSRGPGPGTWRRCDPSRSPPGAAGAGPGRYCRECHTACGDDPKSVHPRTETRVPLPRRPRIRTPVARDPAVMGDDSVAAFDATRRVKPTRSGLSPSGPTAESSPPQARIARTTAGDRGSSRRPKEAVPQRAAPLVPVTSSSVHSSKRPKPFRRATSTPLVLRCRGPVVQHPFVHSRRADHDQRIADIPWAGTDTHRRRPPFDSDHFGKLEAVMTARFRRSAAAAGLVLAGRRCRCTGGRRRGTPVRSGRGAGPTGRCRRAGDRVLRCLPSRRRGPERGSTRSDRPT